MTCNLRHLMGLRHPVLSNYTCVRRCILRISSNTCVRQCLLLIFNHTCVRRCILRIGNKTCVRRCILRISNNMCVQQCLLLLSNDTRVRDDEAIAQSSDWYRIHCQKSCRKGLSIWTLSTAIIMTYRRTRIHTHMHTHIHTHVHTHIRTHTHQHHCTGSRSRVRAQRAQLFWNRRVGAWQRPLSLCCFCLEWAW